MTTSQDCRLRTRLALATLAGAFACAETTLARGTSLNDEFGRHISVPDVDGDGKVSDSEFLAWLSAYVRSVPLVDVTGDNLVTRDDGVAMLGQILTDLQTPPGQATGAEPSAQTMLRAEEILTDLTGPGVIGDGGDDEDLDPWEYHADWVTEQYHDQISTSETRPPGYPPNHDKALTDLWYPPAGSHQTGASSFWPPNHLIQASASWDPGIHDQTQSRHRWPPNHVLDISIEWPTSTPNQHAIVVSRTWNPNHRLAESRDMTPDHYEPISQIDPDSVVPRGHHLAFFTGQWTHNVETSHIWWPGSHYFQISLSWPDTHSMQLSILWPAGHWGNNSVLWPKEGEPPTYPRDWPPNHATAISREWSKPTPIPDWFPSPDHSLFETAQLIPDIIPDGEGVQQQTESR